MNNNSIGTYEAAVREIRNKDKREGLKYWKELLDGFDTRTEITSFGEVPVEEQSNETELGIDVDAEVTRKFTELCRSEDTTTGIGVQLVWGMILCTYSRSEDVVFAKVVSGRDNTKEDVNRTIGLFINTVPVRMMITDKSTPREILKSLQEQSVKSSEYDYCALSEIQSVSELGNRLFQTVLTFQNYADTTSHKAENPKRRSFKIKNAVMKEETFDDLTPVAYMNGDCLHLNLRFDKKKYRESEIRTILSLFETFVSGISYEPDRALVTMDRVSEVQKNAIIKMSTGPELSYDSHETWIDMFLSRVAEDPDHIAVTDDKGTLTYRELDKLSDSVAMYLLQQKVEPDEFVVIKMHRYKEFAAAVIGIHKVGACYVPIDPDYPEDRIAFMESDCRARLVLDRELVLECAELFSVPEPVHKTNPENLAYMIYTSGSTGKPKGAMIPHSALMNYTQIYIRRFGVTKEDRLSHHITFSFDSHIRDFYPALASGASLHFMSDDIVKDPALIVTFLNENRITGAAFATAMGQLLLTEYELKLRFVSVGGEALRGVTGSDIHVFNVCGATEVTDVVLDYELEKGRYYDSVPIGKPLENCYAFILDPYGNILPQGIPGEICYAGKNVGNGYWKRDDLTRAAFTDCPVIPGITMYHTRDLGRYNQDGDVEYMGRLDFQVKLRGFRIELGEVESNAIKYPGIKQVVAKVSDDHLYLYYTADERISADRLRDYLSACLAQYMIPDGFLQLDAMPLTPSGKIDKKSLPAIEKKTIEVIPPENELEKELYDIIRGQIGYDDFGVTSNLISQGMTSLGIMRLSSIIQTKFKASVSVAFIMKEPFIRNISEKIKENLSLTKEPLQNLHSYGRREVYPATENQTGVYLDWEMNRNTTQYNIPVAVCLTDVDTKRFADAIKASLTAHSYMNSCFEITDGMVVQIPRNIDDVNIPVTELNNKPDSRFFQALVKPFDLNSDILYRFEMFTFENQTFLFMDVHHIIFDGLSETIFMEDVLKAYEGQVPEAEEVSAYDFSLFEKELQSSSSFEASKAYFNELLSDFNVMSYPDSETPDGTGQGEVTVRVESKVVDRAVKNMEVTAGSFIHAAFGETMGRFIREDNPVYLTISNGRMGIQKLDRTVGMFVKTVPVVYRRKNAPAGNDSVRDYVFSVSEQLKETYKNELYPYTKLVEENGLRGEILFVYQGGMFEGGEVEGASILELKLDTLKFPITITAYPVDNFYEISFEYDGRRYARKDIELLASCLKQVILDMTYEERLCDVHLISSDEEKLIIERSRGAEINFDTTRTWLDYFKEAVFNHSDSLALADEERSLTYRQLDEEAGAVASYLIERGVQKNEFVALCMDRCTEFVIAVVGIHKAGAAYVPVDINYPEERRNYMLSDSEAKVVLTQKLVREALRAYYNTPKESVAAPEVFSKALSDRSPSPDNFAYMIYTSGSTGRPKGTILHHRGLLNFAIATMKENELTSSDRIGHHFSFSFDSHIEDLYPPLISGASIHIMAESVRRDPDLIFDYINRHGITGGGFTTSIGRILATGYLLPQRYIALMGEALTEITPGETTIINKYGPTECTNIVSTYVLEKGRKYREVPIGRPMPNGAVFLLDTRNNLVPYGCIGELCYAGPQTGFGYWKQEKKTEEVFTECPWIEGTKLYHTGDLARYDRNGELIYLGRIDDQVKVNGFRVEFGEIESAALGYAGVLQAAASVKNGRIVLYYTEKGTEKEPDENKLHIKMSETLADYMMPALFVRLDKMPSTPSGKIDRRALPEPAVFRTTPFTEPVTSTQKTVVLCLKKVLGVSCDIGIYDNFFELGGDSIKAIRLVSLLRDKGLTVSVSDVMKGRTPEMIAELAEEGDSLPKLSQEPIDGPVGNAPITLYFNELKLPLPAHFNQCVCLECKKEPEKDLLQKSLDAILFQHDMLRAFVRGGELFIRKPPCNIKIHCYECEDKNEMSSICSKHQSGIDMEQGLFAAILFHAQNRWYLVFIAHHLIIDALSWRIIISDLESAYGQCLNGKDPQLPLKTNTYRDYVNACQHFSDSYALSLEIPYWKSVKEKMLRHPVSIENDYSRDFKTLGRTMDMEKTSRLLHADFKKIYADIDDVLLTAVSRSYVRIWQTDSVSFQFEGHGREDIGEELIIDRTVGWFTSIYPMVVEHLTGDIKEDLVLVKQMRHSVPNKGVGFNVLRYLSGDRELNDQNKYCARIGFNYFGEMDGEKSSDSFFVMADGIDIGFPIAKENVFGPDLSINAAVTNGCLSMGFSYNTAVCTQQMAEQFVDGIFTDIERICDLPMQRPDVYKCACDYGETEWSIEEFLEVQKDFRSRDLEITRIYPLTPMQESMLLKHISDPESLAYRLCYVFEIDVLLSEEAVFNAVSRLEQKHEVLRSAFIYEKVSRPRQAIIDRKPHVEMKDFSDCPDPDEAAKELRIELLHDMRDLQFEANFRVVVAKKNDKASYLFVLVHHMLVDGWCNSLYLADLYRFLLEETGSKIPADNEEKSLNGRYEQAVRSILLRERKKAVLYWENLLKDYEGSAKIPSFGTVFEDERCIEDTRSVAVSKETTNAILELCRQQKASASNAVELLWGLILQIYNRTKDVVFAKVVSGRDYVNDADKIVGLFINSVPVRVTTDDTLTARDMLTILRNQANASAEWDFCPLVDIQKSTSSGNALVQSVLAFENYNSGLLEMGAGQIPDKTALSFTMKPYIIKEEVFGKIDPLTYIDDDGRLTLKLSFDRNAYGREQIETLLSMFDNLANEIAKSPDTPLALLNKLTNEDAVKVLKISKGDTLDLAGNETWLDLFKESVEKYGSSEAVIDNTGSLSYEELDRQSDIVAAYLVSRGVTKGAFAAIKMERVKEYLVAVLAVHKAGAAFVPVDPSLPGNRIDFMLRDSGCSLVLDHETLTGALEKGDNTAGLPAISGKDPAYMIYTSGSTGEPKGVVLSHHALLSFAAWRCDALEIDHFSRHGQYISFSFDASLDDLICPLCRGAQVYILDHETRNDLEGIDLFIRNNGISSMALPAQVGMALINAHPDVPLKTLIMGGENLTPVHDCDVKLINEYGPTEFTVCSAYHIIDQKKDIEIPIGRPVPGTEALILDENMKLLPIGMVGELCLGGAQIAEGYRNRPELTAEKFVDIEINEEKRRVYRTGDLARYNENKELIFHGRIDRQVKLRGLRIELGEIESCAIRFTGILQAAADVKRDCIVLYYTSEDSVNEADLNTFLSGIISDYMVPSVYVRLLKMPLTSNGKIDYRMLPEPVTESKEDYVSPTGETERRIAEVIQSFLGLSDPVSREDDFFSLGGDSIKLIRVVSALRQSGIELKASDVMKARTVRKMAAIADAAKENTKGGISQQSYTGEIKDSAIISFFRSLNLPVLNHFNQTMLLKFSKKADRMALQKAFDVITKHHDLLRAVWTKDGLYVRDDLSGISIEEYITGTETFTDICNRMQSGIVMDQALVRAALIHDGDDDLFFAAAHHLIIDSVSWSVLQSDLETAYGDALLDKEISLPRKTSSYRDYVEDEYAYRNSYRLTREIPYWDKVERKLKKACSSKRMEDSCHFAYLVHVLDEKETAFFAQSGFENRTVTIGEALLTAAVRSYAAVTGSDLVSALFEGHGRNNINSDLELDRTIGWFTAAYPVVLEKVGSGTIIDDLIGTRETLRRVPNKGTGYMTLKYLPGEKNLASSKELVPLIGFNYLGEISEDKNNDGYFEAAKGYDTGLSTDEKNTFGPELSLNIMLADGKLIISANYSKDRFTDEMIRDFVQGMQKQLKDIADLLRADNIILPVLPSDLGEMEWSVEEFRQVYEEFSGKGEKIRRIYPLLPLQQGMLLAHTMDTKAWGYRLVSIYELNCLPTGKQMERVLDRLCERHEVLKTSIVYKNVSAPRQVICERQLGISEIDLSETADKIGAVYKVREEILTNAFDLQDKPLFQVTVAKTSENTCYLLTAVHHIIVDGWCIKDYMRDLFGLMAEEINEKELLTPSLDLPGSYESAVREILGKDKGAALDYFGRLLSDYQTKAEIPSFGKVSAEERSETDDLRTSIDCDVTRALLELCRSEQATISSMSEMIWGLVLQTYNHTTDVVFTKAVSGRDLKSCDVEHVVGMFINSIPVRVKNDANTTVRELLRSMVRQGAESAAFDYCPLDEIQADSEPFSNLYQSVFSFENYDSGLDPNKASENEATADGIYKGELETKEENYTDIHPYAFVNLKGELVFAISFNRYKYRKVEIERIFELIRVIAFGIVQNPDMAVVKLPRLSLQDTAAMMELSKGRELLYNTDETWMDLFLRRVEIQPEHVAVTDDDGKLSYAELNSQSDAVALGLSIMGVEANDFVVIKIHRVREFAVAVIGIHKLGACYVPIDPDYPKDRIKYMEKDCGAKVVLSRELIKEWVLKYPDPKPVHNTKPEHFAYMIYTSGSTGLPKGAIIPQSALMNYTEIYLRRFGITPDDRVSHHITFSFDSHIRDFYPALAGGASLHFMPDRICKDPDEIYDFLIKNDITVSAFATAMGRILLSRYDLKQRVISVGGEALYDLTGNDIHIFNVCGATEVTDVVLDYELEKGRHYDAVPLGRPLENCYAFIMDEAGNLLPRGVIGEICYAGKNVGSGYWNRPELTEKAFTECPILPGQIMYRTRDLGRYNEEGNVEYLGRMDSQIKLRGYRIELGEIESNAVRFTSVEQAVAAVCDGQLVLYYVAERGTDQRGLKSFLEKTLTDYMVPNIYIRLEAMPMTPSGKIDKKALPKPAKAVNEIIEPSDEIEMWLWRTISDLIGYEHFGVSNNLVAFGLNSIGIMHLSGMIQSEFDAHVRVADIMKDPVIRSIAEMIRNLIGNRADEKLRICAREKRQTYPVTENQLGIFLDWKMHPDTTQYNVPSAFCLKNTDPQRFRKAITDTVNAHPYLKVGFTLREGELLQIRRDELEFSVEVTVLDQEPSPEFFQELVRPFDLLHDVLFRFHIYVFNDMTWGFIDIHHIIYDGLSSVILMEDIQKAYQGEAIRPEEITAFDFALYEKELETRNEYRESEKYFSEMIMDCNALSISDSKEPDGIVFGRSELHIPAWKVDQLLKRCQVTAGSLLQAAFSETLMRLTRVKKLMYLMSSSGRSNANELDRTVGMFVKTLPVVRDEAFDEDGITVKEYVQAVHEQLLNTVSREYYPYTRLVEKYGKRGEILFTYQGGLYDGGEIEGSQLIPLKLNEVKLPLCVTAFPYGNEYMISIDYDGRKYSHEDINRITRAMGNVIDGMTKEIFLKDVSALSEGEIPEAAEASAGEKLYVNDTRTRNDRKSSPDFLISVPEFACEDPANPEEEAALKELRKLIPGAMFGVTDDLFEAGMNSIIAMKLVAQLETLTHKTYKMGRLLSRRNIRDFLKEDPEIVRFYKPYDETKPVLVVPSGNTTLVGTEHLYRSWDGLFNILIIEPLSVHYEKLLSGKSFDDVVNYYLEEIKKSIPDSSKLFGFLGFSFGGELAYHLACKWKNISGEKKVVIMGDTYIKRRIPDNQVEQLTSESFDSSVEKFLLSEGLTMDDILYMANLTRRLDATRKDVSGYDGTVIYLNAMKDSTEKSREDKLKLLKEICPQCRIIDLPEHDHGSIFLSSEMEKFYLEIFKELMIDIY